MAIQEITDLEIVQRCAGCDRENRVALVNLAVGVEHAEQVEDGVVPLPECPTCRSREFLVRSPASEQAHLVLRTAPGQGGHEERDTAAIRHPHPTSERNPRVAVTTLARPLANVNRPMGSLT